jgi:protein SCO1/2
VLRIAHRMPALVSTSGASTRRIARRLRDIVTALVRCLYTLAMLGAIASCTQAPTTFKTSDITGSSFARDFKLKDPSGATRTLADFRGKVVVVFFGYTHCPDACPTTLADLAAAMKKLGPDASRVQVLFITVDPERDTPALLAQYVPAFNPSFLGLYGDAAATEAVAKEYKVIYQKHAGDTPGNYTVDHSAGSFIYDPQGRVRLYASYGQGADVFAHDIAALLKAS